MSRPGDQVRKQMQAANQQYQRYIRKFFGYSFAFGSVAASASGTSQISIQADSDFLVQQITYGAFDFTALAAVPGFATLQIVDQGSGSNVFDQSTPLNNFAGNGTLPYILPEPLLLARNANLTGTLTNYASTNAVTYWVTLLGKRIYNLGA